MKLHEIKRNHSVHDFKIWLKTENLYIYFFFFFFFSEKTDLTFHVNHLPTDDSQEISRLIWFLKALKQQQSLKKKSAAKF